MPADICVRPTMNLGAVQTHVIRRPSRRITTEVGSGGNSPPFSSPFFLFLTLTSSLSCPSQRPTLRVRLSCEPISLSTNRPFTSKRQRLPPLPQLSPTLHTTTFQRRAYASHLSFCLDWLPVRHSVLLYLQLMLMLRQPHSSSLPSGSGYGGCYQRRV